MSVFQSPGVLPKGKTETGIGVSFITNEKELYFVNLKVHTRRGLGKNWEAGAKLFLLNKVYSNKIIPVFFKI